MVPEFKSRMISQDNVRKEINRMPASKSFYLTFFN